MSKNCDNCIHKEVCKFKETATDKKVEEPFEISCKHYMDSKPTLTYPYGPNYAYKGKGIKLNSTSPCETCGYYDMTSKKCTIGGKPMGIVGLPCQTIATCSTAESGIK